VRKESHRLAQGGPKEKKDLNVPRRHLVDGLTIGFGERETMKQRRGRRRSKNVLGRRKGETTA